LKLEVVDVDHFSADTALRHNYPDTISKLIALVGINAHRLDVSLIRHNDLESYSYITPTSTNEIVTHIANIAHGTKALTSVSVYGTHLTPELLTQLRLSTSIPIETINPFRSIDVADSLRLQADPTVASYRYCPVVGVALRRD
jgi:Tfp pilus assembly PilM family ATPase